MAKINWVRCPICDEPDMRAELAEDVLLHEKKECYYVQCVNLACASNISEASTINRRVMMNNIDVVEAIRLVKEGSKDLLQKLETFELRLKDLAKLK